MEKPKKPKVTKAKNIGVQLMIALLLSILTLSACNTNDNEFTAERWARTAKVKRYLLVESLGEKCGFVGMNIGEVEELLGSPDYVIPETEYPDKPTGRERYEYIIKDDPVAGRRVLVFVNEKDIIAEVFEGWEDW